MKDGSTLHTVLFSNSCKKMSPGSFPVPSKIAGETAFSHLFIATLNLFLGQ